MKATSGGTFAPDESPLYFIAGSPSMLRGVGYRNVLLAVNEVRTQAHRDELERFLDQGRRVLIDSGIFNLAMGHARAHGLHMDDALRLHPSEVDGWPELRDRYYDVATRYVHRVWGIIELDQGGASVKPETRAMIEADTGITPMPVYHPLLDGWDYYDTLATGYDRLAFGNIVKASPPVRLRLIHTAYERARKYPHLWTHLLGLYPNENTLGLPMRGSFDSSSWLTGVRWMPSWKDWTMLRMEGHFPPDMWYETGPRDDQAGAGRAEQVLGHTAEFTQRTLTAIGEDTHSWV